MVYYDELWKNGPRLARSEEAFSLSTDSVMLANFVSAKSAKQIIDLGCGAGVLTVLMAEKYPRAQITGLEIQEESARLSRLSLEASKTQNAEIICGDLRECRKIFAAGQFDMLVSNPPYFPVNSGYSAPNESRRIAREEVCCNLQDLFSAAGYLCRFGGTFCLVHRAERLSEIFSTAEKFGFAPKRLRMVCHRLSLAPNIVLIECKRGAKSGLHIDPPLILANEDGTDSDEAILIYHKSI